MLVVGHELCARGRHLLHLRAQLRRPRHHVSRCPFKFMTLTLLRYGDVCMSDLLLCGSHSLWMCLGRQSATYDEHKACICLYRTMIAVAICINLVSMSISKPDVLKPVK